MRRKIKKSVGGLLFCYAAASQPAMAQTMVPKLDHEGRKGDVARIAKQKAQERFSALDSDKDDKLSRLEVDQGAHYLAEKFDERDLNHDGSLSWEEFVGHNRWDK